MEYKFNNIEKKWQDEWKKRHTYRTENHSDRPKYYVLDMFPYPSGAGLHVGHPLGFIASDIVARYKRLTGFNVLHPMGFDSFGLPAEQYAIQTGQHPEKTTKENIARYIDQMNKIGFSFDWEREVRTSDPSYYKWTQWIFLQIFKSWYNNKTKKAESIDSLIAIFEKQGFSGSDDHILTGGIEHDIKPFTAEQWKNFSEKEKSDVLMHFRLAYLDEAWVNWCPALGTVLANDEVKDGVSERGGHPVERKRMPQWSMRITAYADRLLNDLDKLDWTESMKEAQRNWIGRSEGTSLKFQIENSKEQIEVFTTRPDTIFGVTFVTLAPEHELVSQITTAEYKTKVDEYVTMAKNRSERERMADVKKITGQFTGAYVIHPFTNEKVPVWIGDYVLAGYGTGAVMAVPAHDSRDYAFAKHFGLPIKQVITPAGSSEVENKGESYDAKEGKCINSDFLNGLEVKDALKKAIAEVEKRGLGKGKTNYRLRDAAFGRQRYWGEPIPVYYKDGIPCVVDEADLPIVLPQVDKFLPTEGGEPPLARAKNWVYQPHPRPLSGGEGSLNKNISGVEGNPSDEKSLSGGEGSLNKNISGVEGNPGDEKSLSGEEGSLSKNISGGEGSYDVADDQNEDWILKEALYHYQTAKKEAWAKLKNMARDNRKSPTEAENILWQELRNKKTGFKIRRQHAIDVFIADFVCIRKRVVIEVDGNYHNDPEQRVYDEQRTAILNDMGFDVIRFHNDEVIHNISDVVMRITKILSEKQPPVSAPSGHAEGGAETGGYPLETTTMPGWAGSSWYYLRYMDPKNEKEFVSQDAVNYWKNVDLYIGGAEHATGHLLYVRFWTKFLFDRGFIPVEEPAQKLINQGMIQGVSMIASVILIPTKFDGDIPIEIEYAMVNPDSNAQLGEYRFPVEFVKFQDGKYFADKEVVELTRQNYPAFADFKIGDTVELVPQIEKMSKSKWNVVTPDSICNDYGADTLRLYEMFLGPLEQHKPWNTNGITGVFGFLKRFWRLFFDEAGKVRVSNDAASEAELKVVHRTLKKIKDDIERYSFNTCVSQFMICVNELTDMKTSKREALEPLVIALSPFAPHIAEELWEILGHKESVTKAAYPAVIEKYLTDDSFTYPVQINGKLRFNFTASLKLTPAEIEKEILSSEEAAKYLEGKSPKKVIVVPKRIVNIVI